MSRWGKLLVCCQLSQELGVNLISQGVVLLLFQLIYLFTYHYHRITSPSHKNGYRQQLRLLFNVCSSLSISYVLCGHFTFKWSVRRGQCCKKTQKADNKYIKAVKNLCVQVAHKHDSMACQGYYDDDIIQHKHNDLNESNFYSLVNSACVSVCPIVYLPTQYRLVQVINVCKNISNFKKSTRTEQTTPLPIRRLPGESIQWRDAFKRVNKNNIVYLTKIYLAKISNNFTQTETKIYVTQKL